MHAIHVVHACMPFMCFMLFMHACIVVMCFSCTSYGLYVFFMSPMHACDCWFMCNSCMHVLLVVLLIFDAVRACMVIFSVCSHVMSMHGKWIQSNYLLNMHKAK